MGAACSEASVGLSRDAVEAGDAGHKGQRHALGPPAPLRASGGHLGRLDQGFHRRLAADRLRGRSTLGCALAGAQLAEALWSTGDLHKALATYAFTTELCEKVVEDSGGAASGELLLAEVLLGRALLLREVSSIGDPDKGNANSGHKGSPLGLLRTARKLALHHVGDGRPEGNRAALLAAVATQNLGMMWFERGDVHAARSLFEEALARLCEIDAEQAPAPEGCEQSPPRHACVEHVQRNLLRCRASAGDPEPTYWWHNGLAAVYSQYGDEDSSLAHTLCASALLGNDSDSVHEQRGDCTDEARCELWLDIADGFESRGDQESAKAYRDRAHRYARQVGLPVACQARRRAWAHQLRKLPHGLRNRVEYGAGQSSYSFIKRGKT